MPKNKKPLAERSSAYPDREIIAKAEGRFAKADKQRASIKSDPKRAVERAKERVGHIKKAKKKSSTRT
jgi:hypothetical protein